MKPQSVLFVTSQIRSHIIPSFFLAKLFSEFNIYYTVSTDYCEDLVKRQKFNTIRTTSPRFAMGEDPLVFYSENGYSGNVLPFFNTSLFYLRNTIYRRREAEFDKIIEEINPTLIFIDMYCSTDFLVIFNKKRNIKILFFSPMLSTYKIDNYPVLSQAMWNEVAKEKNRSFFRFDFNKVVLKGINYLTGLNPSLQRYLVHRKKKMTKSYRFAKNNLYTLAFENVPEIVLAPLELEFSEKIKRSNQYYLGLCIAETREDIETDPSFEQAFEKIKEKDDGRKLIYCSFGTYFSAVEDHKKVYSFVTALNEVAHHAHDKNFIIAVNERIKILVNENLSLSKNVIIFSRVNQLKVLEHADLFITHGGLGSVKEAIYFRTPMLVYPLDQGFDQPGNSLKVEYHSIGLRGDIEKDEPYEILRKIENILHSQHYKENINNFNSKIIDTYTPDFIRMIKDFALRKV